MKPPAALRLSAELSNLGAIREWLEARALEGDVPPALVPRLFLAAEEAVSNIVRHGYRGGAGEIELSFFYRKGEAVLRIRDAAPPFDPLAHPAPDTTLPLEARRPGGMGIHLMRKSVDEVRHRPLPGGGNELELVLRFGSAPA